MGPNMSSSESIGGEYCCSSRGRRAFRRGARAGGEVLARESMRTGTERRAGTCTSFSNFSSSSNLTVFFERADAVVRLSASSTLTVFLETADAGKQGTQTEGLLGLGLDLGWKKPCPSGPFVPFNTFVNRAWRAISSSACVSQTLMASSRSYPTLSNAPRASPSPRNV
jgi:hypothetical protein